MDWFGFLKDKRSKREFEQLIELLPIVHALNDEQVTTLTGIIKQRGGKKSLITACERISNARKSRALILRNIVKDVNDIARGLFR